MERNPSDSSCTSSEPTDSESECGDYNNHCTSDQPGRTCLHEPVHIDQGRPTLARQLELAIFDVAATLRDKPLNPVGGRLRFPWPSVHCAFNNCAEEGPSDTWLAKHIDSKHSKVFQACHQIAQQLSFRATNFEYYCAAVREHERQSLPDTSEQRNHKHQRIFHSEFRDEHIMSLVCFCCARILVFDSKDPACEIQYYKAMENGRFMGMSAEQLQNILGLDRYIQTYKPTKYHLRDLKQWSVNVIFPHGDTVTVLACAEDRKCTNHLHNTRVCCVCEQCEIPVCTSCAGSLTLKIPKLPKFAMSNDMWTGFVLEYISKNKLTYVDIICASPLMPTMISSQIDYFRDGFGVEMHKGASLLGQFAQQPHGPCSARGNITAFGLPWDEILAEFASIMTHGSSRAELPRVGEDLTDVLQIIIRTEAGLDKDADVREQAILLSSCVTRKYVMELIEIGVTYEHVGFQGFQECDIKKMHERAQKHLPVKAVPPEVMVNLQTLRQMRNPILEGKGAIPGNAPASSSTDPLAQPDVNSVMPDVEQGTHIDKMEQLRRVMVDLASPVCFLPTVSFLCPFLTFYVSSFSCLSSAAHVASAASEHVLVIRHQTHR